MSDGTLREFLTSRRAAITPDMAGLPAATATRRVPGLRREEVAILAGVSVEYYIKLEQGRASNISEPVLHAIEQALQLDDIERRHLRTLVRASQRGASGSAARPKARPAVLAMVDAMSVPAMVHGPLLEVLGMNAVARVLFDDFSAMPVGHRNLARWMFLNPRAREVYLDWEKHAADMVGILRAVPDGPRSEALQRLVQELSSTAPDFARHWADYRIFEHTHGVKRFFNETVGELKVNFETLPLPGDEGQNLIVYSADVGSPSAEKLQLLGNWAASPKSTQPR
ncbi:helix-turn-helix transcriptional regulator [Kineosporia babensis]|uniref:Helix-turn-helix transcriptional regulator n=1 Tax=Kineosporia babensis TaxID=499548 RepID=A0A9X1N8U8_9ACTN|nr:helix-turn-helix transcriptional regulator [Kineosporia babensis]MCD5310652.1 helix-turn-helix transcriptional regulator [Kineosporia babensis]